MLSVQLYAPRRLQRGNRLVPIPTGSFLGGIASCNEVSTISAQTKEGISKFGYEVTYSRHVLESFAE